MANNDSLRKKEAFKSFLETSSTPTIDSKKNASDNEAVYEQQYVEQLTSCNVCGVDVPDAITKKKNCGFCQQVSCQEHMRKRRRKKNKWEKICDNCEDKYLYDTYMKLEIKAEESLAVEEEIIGMKYDDARQLLENKRVKRRQLSFGSQQMQSKFDQKMMVLIKQDNRFQSLNNKLQSDEIMCSQVEQYINRMQNKIKSNYEQDFRILSEQDEKLSQQLSRVQKKCSQVRYAIQKRQKQLQEAYQQWQRRQYNKTQQSPQSSSQKNKGKEDGCFIF